MRSSGRIQVNTAPIWPRGDDARPAGVAAGDVEQRGAENAPIGARLWKSSSVTA